MTQEELERLLDLLLAQWENEVVEFKRAGKGFSTGEIGEYFSALSNEANLACCSRAWLVFGIDNKTRKVAHLRREGLIEGRLPHIHVSAKIAALTGQEAAYMRRKERPSAYYRNLLLEYIAKFDGSSREKINEYMVEERGDTRRPD